MRKTNEVANPKITALSIERNRLSLLRSQYEKGGVSALNYDAHREAVRAMDKVDYDMEELYYDQADRDAKPNEMQMNDF